MTAAITVGTASITGGITIAATTVGITEARAIRPSPSITTTRITTAATRATMRAAPATTAITITPRARTTSAIQGIIPVATSITGRTLRTTSTATTTTCAAAAITAARTTITAAEPRRGTPPGGEPGAMENPENVDQAQAPDMPILARIVVPVSAVTKESVGEVRGMTREHCRVPLPPSARVVSAERTEGAWVVWYVEKVEAI